ncbi:MAG: 5-formyltetrahydrofolate cyclo-ligase [Butyrivibrio sp.]|nr:5-formyltetrahydrofolate cyclo-ligase [Muribaculum sp.]MCM1552854.1 5-formyltetrahydrofolate cyclo-ligase [Butyrivibrio sp.]
MGSDEAGEVSHGESAICRVIEMESSGSNVATESDVMQQKKLLRKRILQTRDAIGRQERERAQVLLTERILGHQWFYMSDVVLGFACYGSEINIDEILQEALRKGKKLYLPKVEGEEMFFYRVDDLSKLSVGYKGIMEPEGDTERYVYAPTEHRRELMLMPGVAFDPFRNRMGYGKGFYDCFLSDKPQLQLCTIAVGFACQMVEQVPCGERDIRPYQVICV